MASSEIKLHMSADMCRDKMCGSHLMWLWFSLTPPPFLQSKIMAESVFEQTAGRRSMYPLQPFWLFAAVSMPAAPYQINC